jgi:hypothetical protein
LLSDAVGRLLVAFGNSSGNQIRAVETISRLLLAINGAENNKFWSASALKSPFSLFAHDFKDDVVKLIFKKY